MPKYLIWALPLLLAGCGSGGNGAVSPAPTPAPTTTPTPTANVAPAFTSPATATVMEGTKLAYQATAVDANGDPITFYVWGGADARSFTISPTGTLNFTAPPYTLTNDANGDHVYEVQLRASDGNLASLLDLRVTVATPPRDIRLRRIASGIYTPHFYAPYPPADNSRFLVGTRRGQVFLQSVAGGGGEFDGVPWGSGGGNEETGLLAVAALPGSRLLLVHHTLDDYTSEVIEFNIDTRVHRRLLLLPHRTNSTMNFGGWMAFGPDGYLYLATGDGGGTGDPDNNAQNPSSLLGKILRIKVDRTSGTTVFAPAPGNPYIGGGGNPLVFAMGLQNPRRASFDGNRLIIVDVGQSNTDEIDLMPLDQPGLNFGWPYLEGTTPYRGSAPAGLTAPVFLYPHSAGPRVPNSTVGSMLGGYVYHGPIAALQGQYIFGDYLFGNIYTIPASALVQGQISTFASAQNRTAAFTPLLGNGDIEQISSFGMDDSGHFFIIDFMTSGSYLAGEVFLVEPG
ncbi:PQQ-dependent sugar dehydrogenase [Sphingomonas sp. KR3-1]|uniref:PQQ-dependent sugar dehydrogenase n=1 Tax=Sphingomonas sp. KR3-1 TaxID=3156611 RepID=UPI0032B42937